jgi:uncharacterized protein (DUF2062 family)
MRVVGWKVPLIEPRKTSTDQLSRWRGLLSWQGAYERFLKIRGTPREIGLGFALGVFLAFSPTMGAQMAIAVFVAALLKWNKLSAAVGVWVSNPLTAPLLYTLTYLTGAWILQIGNKPPSATALESPSAFITLLQKTPDILYALLLGGVILGLPAAMAGYLFAYTAVKKYQDDIKAKLAARKARRAQKKKKKGKPRGKRGGKNR